MGQSRGGVVGDKLIFMDIYVHVVLYSKIERRSEAKLKDFSFFLEFYANLQCFSINTMIIIIISELCAELRQWLYLNEVEFL